MFSKGVFHELQFQRFWAIVVKEFIQMRRDRLTFGMMVGIPMIQLILFGYAINSNPKHLPTAVYAADNSVFSRTLVWGCATAATSTSRARRTARRKSGSWLAEGTVQFAVTGRGIFHANCCAAKNPICC